MALPAPDNQTGQVPTAQGPREFERGSPAGESATSHFLSNFGFHLLVVLLGIALAFM